MSRSTVVIGLLGPQKDGSRSRARRWDGWRPSVGMCQQEDFVVDRFAPHGGMPARLRVRPKTPFGGGGGATA